TSLQPLGLQALVFQALEEVHDVVFLVGASQVVFVVIADGAIPAGFHAGTAEAALGEVQYVLGDGLLLGSLQLGAFHRDAVARAGALAEFTGETFGFARATAS